MNIKFNKKYTHEEFFNPDFQNWLQKNMPVGKIKVDSNPYNQGKQVELYYFFDHIDNFSTYIINQDNIDGVYYCFDIRWKQDYTGTFTLLNPYQNIKPKIKETINIDGIDYTLSEIKKALKNL